MDKEQFWQIINESRKESGLDLDKQTGFLIEKIKKLPVPDILDFRRHVEEQLRNSYTSHMWAVAYIALGGCSDDSFDYFRGWLIAQGKEVFEKAQKNPDSLEKPLEEYLKAKLEPISEDMLSIAQEAYEQGYNKIDFWSVLREKYPDKIKNPTMAFDWDEEDEETLKKIAPKIFAKFWN